MDTAVQNGSLCTIHICYRIPLISP